MPTKKSDIAAARDRLLLHNQYAPITREFLLIEADASEASRCFMQWQQEVLQAGETQERRSAGYGVEASLRALGTVTPWALREVFVPSILDQWCAVFQNCSQTGDHASLAWNLAERFQITSVRVVDAPDAFDFDRNVGVYGNRVFEFVPGANAKARGLNLLRTGPTSWEFVTGGDPLPFERTDLYAARRKADRFTHDTLVDYLAALSLHPFDESFFPADTESLLVERLSPAISRRQREYELREARLTQEDA